MSPRLLAAQRSVYCLNTTHSIMVLVTTKRALTTDFTQSFRGSARHPLLVHYIFQHARVTVVHYTLQYSRGHTNEQYPDVTRLLLSAVSTVVTKLQNSRVTTTRAVTTDVTPSPRGSAPCPLFEHYTLQHAKCHD
ncbi:hypothetical protein J6590_085230 [Homalodisca vitripennis]|nr:hypothetical protein J6590_085230 [Homalodisca vitripennis]